jgi:hypothetical protein
MKEFFGMIAIGAGAIAGYIMLSTPGAQIGGAILAGALLWIGYELLHRNSKERL